jgi:hypothetical protein
VAGAREPSEGSEPEANRPQKEKLAEHQKYRGRPTDYCEQQLGVKLTPAQEQIARLLVEPPYKVLVRAGHNVGKSFIAACMVNWWFDSFDPGVCLTTAPTDRQVKDILWKEVRNLRTGVKSQVPKGVFPGPKACRMETTSGHFAHGFTARDGDRFQGQHSAAVFIVFDEAEGVAPIFWEAAEAMLGGGDFAFLGVYNPTAQSGPTADAERSGRYHLITMSALDHPNIAAELQGNIPPYPSAIRLGRLREMLEQWSAPAASPDVSGAICLGDRCYLPGPVARARLLGVRPTAGFNAVWPEWVFDQAVRRMLPEMGPLQIGCDVARFGDDFTAIHVRRGGVSLYHQSANGWSVADTSKRLQQVAFEHAARVGVNPLRVPVAIDDVGVGGGVTDVLRADGWNAVGVNVARQAPDPEEYPNLRSALWFGLSEEAARGNVSFARLPQLVLADLRRELTAPTYTLDIRGRRQVESKDQTKERLKRSPDNADATLLAYTNVSAVGERVAGRLEVP